VKVLFLDESGDHNLIVLDPQYPVFVLGGVIVDKQYAEGAMTERMQQFKRELFGRDDLILHTADIARNKNGFEQLRDQGFRQRFYDGLNTLMRELEYQVVACAIKKDAHLARDGVAALDPYLLSLDILVERFCYEIGSRAAGGLIVAEKRNPTLDHELELAWLNLKIQGTRHLQATEIERRIASLNTRDKRENISGLQLADLVVSPIGRFVMGKTSMEDFQIVGSKFRHNTEGAYLGRGLVILPKQ